jgi:C4-dicarboxylate transporter DctQ subunit
MFPWSEEFGRYTFMWTTFFGAAMCTKYGRHLVIDILINSARRRFKIIMEFIVNIVTITLMAVLIFYGWKLTIASDVPTASLGIPLSYVVFGVPFSCTLILIRTLVGMVKQLRAATSVRR